MPDIPAKEVFNLPPDDAVEFYRGRGLRLRGNDYNNLTRAAADRAFFVAGISNEQTLNRLRASLTNALRRGITFERWRENVQGFTGLSVGRLRTIFRTNNAAALNAGIFAETQRRVASGERLVTRYSAIGDARTRPSHLALDGKTAYADNPFWQANTPPLAWNCRCSVITLSEESAREAGWDVTPARELRALTSQNIAAPSFRAPPGLANPLLASRLLNETQSLEAWSKYGNTSQVAAATGFSAFVNNQIGTPNFPIGYIPNEARNALNISPRDALFFGDRDGIDRAVNALVRKGIERETARTIISRLAMSLNGRYLLTGGGVVVLRKGEREYRFVRDGNRGYRLYTAKQT